MTTKQDTDRRTVGELLHYLARRADNPTARMWDSALRDVLYLPATGTARAWMQAHDKALVSTLQARVHVSGDVSGVWTPGPRTVDASRASSVSLDGSSRDYRGMRVVAAGPDVLVAVAPWGEDQVHICVYTSKF